jgi:hypothetical protein
MLDLLSHFTVLDVLRARLHADVSGGALADKRLDRASDALDTDNAYAVLGAVLDHLLAHDGSTSQAELDLLEQALAIWNTVRQFQLDFRATRADIEQLAINPAAPTALAQFNAARLAMARLIERHDALVASLQAFQWQLFPLGHLTPHPIANDDPVEAWPWRDVVLSRSTGAFTRNLVHLARNDGTPQALGFAVGALAGYAANAVGGPYLVHGVGGPRRSHPYRERLASYAVGTWLMHVPLPLPAHFDRTRALPMFGSPNNPALPPWLGELIAKALHITYGERAAAGMPDLDAAYARLMRHWRLLHSFEPLAEAAPIDATLRTRINTTLTPADYDRPDVGTPGGGDTGPAPGPGGNIFDPGPGAPPWFRPSHDNVADWIAEICLDILFLPILLIRIGFYLGHKGGSAKPATTGQAATALSTPVTQAEYDSAMGGKDILITINELFYLDDAVQQLALDCMRLLKYVGLLYPQAKELHNPEFAECLVLPPASLGFEWPARPLANPNRILDLPTSPPERPVQPPSGFAPGEKPIAFIVRGIGTGAAVLDAGYDILTHELLELPTSPVRNADFNLDGDRGAQHPCWETEAGTSIKDDPVSITVLAYGTP